MKRELNPVSSLSALAGLALLLGASLLAGAACADADPADGARTDPLGDTDPSSPAATDMMGTAPAPTDGSVPLPPAPGPAAVPPAQPGDPAAVPPPAPAPVSTPGPAVDPSQGIDPNQGVTPMAPTPASTPVEPAPVEPVSTPAEPSPTPAPAPVATMDPVTPAPAGGELLADQCEGIKKDMACPAAGTCSNLSCGLADTGTRTCTCATTWSCTSCTFPMGADQPSILVPPTADNPLMPCDTTVAVEKEVCSVMGERCSLGEEVCACWATNSDGLPIWDCDSAPSFW